MNLLEIPCALVMQDSFKQKQNETTLQTRNSEARRRAARLGPLPRLHDGDDPYALTPTILSNVGKANPLC